MYRLVFCKRVVLIGLFFILLSTSGFCEQKVKIDYPNTPIIYNKTLTLADTEYLQALPAGITKIMVQCRTSYDIKIAYTSGESGTTYFTIKAEHTYWDDEISGTKQTLYIQSSQAGVVVEILCWYD